MSGKFITVKEIAKEFGLSYQVINRYSDAGLLSIAFKKGNIRYYERKTVEKRMKHISVQASNLLNTMKSDIGKVLLDSESGVVLVIDTPDRVANMESALQAMEHKSVLRVFTLKYARAKEIEEQLKAQLDTKKVGSIKADERTNQVVV